MKINRNYMLAARASASGRQVPFYYAQIMSPSKRAASKLKLMRLGYCAQRNHEIMRINGNLSLIFSALTALVYFQLNFIYEWLG